MKNTTPVDIRHYAHQGAAVAARNIADIEREFLRQARWYRTFFKDCLPLRIDGPILDAPCGHGNFLFFLRARQEVDYRGVDIDGARVRVATELGLPAAVGDVFESIAQQRDLGMIASIDFLEHIEKHVVPSLLGDMYSALRRGGILILRMPVTDSLLGSYDLHNDFTHKWAANSHVVRDLILQAGFRSVVLKDERPVPYRVLKRLQLAGFYPCKWAINTGLAILGFPRFTVWSRSVWFIARKG